MIGTPNKLEVRVSRKLSDGEYGSMEISASLEVNLGPNDNPENAFDGADLWLTAKIAKSLAEKQAEAQKPRLTAELAEAEHEDTGLGPKPEPKAETADKAKKGEEVSFKCAKFTLAKLPDKKYKLELYPEIKGEPGKYPTVRYTAERDAMWGMLEGVADDFDFTDLPVEYKAEWLVHYVIGREFVISSGEHKGEKSHYKDLVAIKWMEPREGNGPACNPYEGMTASEKEEYLREQDGR